MANKKFEIKGNTTAQKFKFLETILPRLYKKLNPNMTIAIPPSVISHYAVSASDVIMNSMVFKGELLKVLLRMDAVTNGGQAVEADLKCSIISGEDERSVNIVTKKNLLVLDLNIQTEDGDLIKIASNSPDLIYSNIYISLLFVPDFVRKDKILVEGFYEDI